MVSCAFCGNVIDNGDRITILTSGVLSGTEGNALQLSKADSSPACEACADEMRDAFREPIPFDPVSFAD